MARRITTIVYLLMVIVISGSAFKYYVDYRGDKLNVPKKYDQAQDIYNKKSDEIRQKNDLIYQDVLNKFEELGGDRNTLSRYDAIRFYSGSDTSNELLNSIDHPPLFSVDMEEPPYGQYRNSLEAADISKLQGVLKFKFIVHGFILFVVSLMYIILLLAFGKKKRV